MWIFAHSCHLPSLQFSGLDLNDRNTSVRGRGATKYVPPHLRRQPQQDDGPAAREHSEERPGNESWGSSKYVIGSVVGRV
jgi:hypothetical protein